MQDLGFMGLELPGVEFIMPHKKPPGEELSLAQKEENRQVSKIRVRIEHVLGSIKRCRILKDTVRLLRKGARDLVMEIGCALHNFRLRFSTWGVMV